MTATHISLTWSLHTEGSDDEVILVPSATTSGGAGAGTIFPGTLTLTMLHHNLGTSSKTVLSTISWPTHQVVLGQVTTATIVAPPLAVEDASPGGLEFLLHAEHTASCNSPKLVLVREALAKESLSDGSNSTFVKWSAGHLVRVEAEGQPHVDVLLVASVIEANFSSASQPASPSIHDAVTQHALQTYVNQFKALVAHPRWTVIKAQFTTAIDDILLLEEKLEAAVRERDAIAAAASSSSQEQAQHVQRQATSEVVPLPSASPNNGSQEETNATSSHEAPSPLREEKSLRAVIRAKDSELFVMRARIQAMEESRKAELDHLRTQLGKLKQKRTELVEKQEQKKMQKSPVAGKAKQQQNVIVGEAAGEEATKANRPVGSHNSQGEGSCVGNASRQPSPAARPHTPLRQHVRTVSDYTRRVAPALGPPQPKEDDDRPRPQQTTQQYDDDRRARLERLEESFAKLQSRHYTARHAAQAHLYSDPSPSVSLQNCNGSSLSRTASPLRVPDTAAALRLASSIKRNATSTSVGLTADAAAASGGEAASAQHESLGDVSKAATTTANNQSGVGNNTTRQSSTRTSSSQQRASSPLLRISPGRFRTVLDPFEKKPPMHRR